MSREVQDNIFRSNCCRDFKWDPYAHLYTHATISTMLSVTCVSLFLMMESVLPESILTMESILPGLFLGTARSWV